MPREAACIAAVLHHDARRLRSSSGIRFSSTPTGER